MYKGNKFKNTAGAHLLKALFFEEAVDTDRPDALYTLKLEDHDVPGEKVYLSIHRAYVQLQDEFKLANQYFDGWSHWKKLCACNWFKPFLDDMREEVDVSVKAKALNSIRDVASNVEDKNSYNANKFLLENGIAIKKDMRGRPSKEKIKQEADKLFVLREEVDEDYERIFGVRPNSH